MSKRKRVTADEKRTRMLGYFHEKKEFFTLKELETTVPKECGIIQQAVKDVLQALVDDGLVHSDKIGTSVYFWSFPGERIPALEAQIGETGKKILTLETKLERLKCDIKKEEENKVDFEKTKAVLNEIEILKNKEEKLKKQITKFSDADPEVIAELNKKAKFYKDGANTWTDNIFNLKTWCKNKFNIEESELNKQFRIPEDLDYLE
ncbi:meiotic nuclear divisions 1 homolog isoform X1 [Nasonia vitripennis]|uniref:Meiotic nuclear division protein 1 homolog n=1 Tax=Nasonia vitripennis TaxID=7425 RepID=A0A7M7QQP7_NASVI|nr:meiotic nuclear divisions 1 homolog [Nasonia vitripennis]XP_008202078.1 meiotic nuclear divisions 1 homolog isoform X1 [Nasonia vitripennis]XP_032452217.1 meiotic nuclear divisions 1 homolog isoform X1 [Nasonia vitripennis]XP_032452218.1 meiotic nuclear divisions 1 homolog isoform X1 [Nasonia vitripennis]